MYVGLARRAHRMLEVGFNAGHSATLALIANPTLEYHALDLCQHNYTRRCFQLLMFRFPGRVSLTCGDSTVRLRELELERWVPPRWRSGGGGTFGGARGGRSTKAAAAGSGKANGRRAASGYEARGYDLLHIDGGHAGKGARSRRLHVGRVRRSKSQMSHNHPRPDGSIRPHPTDVPSSADSRPAQRAPPCEGRQCRAL